MRRTIPHVLAAALLASCQPPTPSAPASPPLRALPSAKPVPAVGEGLPPQLPVRRLAEPSTGAYVERGDKIEHNVKVHCVLADDGAVSCTWGDLAPSKISGVGPATQIVAGDAHVCALERTGSVACFSTKTNATVARPLNLPFRVRRIAGNESGIVVEAQQGEVHYCALSHDARLTSCALTRLDVPDADAYVEAGLVRCSLDAERAASCRGRASDNDDGGDRPISVPGFPKRIRRLVEGLEAYETGAVVCAIGDAGELACFHGLEQSGPSGFLAKAVPLAVPGPVRDLAIGSSLGRVVLEDGRVYAIPMSTTRAYPPGWTMFVPRHVPLPEPADSVSETCVRYRSGRVACGPDR